MSGEELRKENQSAENPNGLCFKDYISEKMLAVEGREGKAHASSADLADALGLSTKVLQEILNGRRSGPDRRDLVIAVCAQLGLDAEETNEALRLYPGFLHKLADDDARDQAIVKFLNAGFDAEISFETLNSYLAEQGFPELKIRHRNPPQNECERRKPMKKIDWSMKSATERGYYKYYISLGYDDVTSSVLALFTYGSKIIPEFSICDAYNALADGGVYPPPPPPIMAAEELFDDSTGLTRPQMSVGPGSSATAGKAKRPASSVRDYRPSQSPVFGSPSIVDYDYIESRRNKFPARLNHASRPLAEKKRCMVFSADSDTDAYEPIEEKGQQPLVSNATSTFRMTTNTASVGIVLNQLRNRRTITRDMVRIEEWLNYFRYQTALPDEEKFRISHELQNRENGTRLLYVNVQGKTEEKAQQNIVLLLDVSGSMYSHAAKTQAAIATVVSKLKPGCIFSLVTYGPCDTVVVDGLRIDSYESKLKVLEKLLGLKIDGFTNGSAGIERAYQVGRRNYIAGGNNQVILITDGDLNFGIVSKGGLEKLIEEEKRSNLFLSVLGIGLTNFKDDKLEVLSKHGNGVYRVINSLSDVEKSVRDEYASLVNIIAKDVKAQIEFNPELVSSFRLLGFENRELSHAEFRDDTVISEPFGSGGYGIALYELRMKEPGETVLADMKYRKVISTGSDELATVKVRYKEPLNDYSHELEYIIPSAEEHYTDNILLAWIVYVCAEKLRDSGKITERDEALALAALDELDREIMLSNYNDIGKLREILRQSKQQLHVGSSVSSGYEW